MPLSREDSVRWPGDPMPEVKMSPATEGPAGLLAGLFLFPTSQDYAIQVYTRARQILKRLYAGAQPGARKRWCPRRCR